MVEDNGMPKRLRNLEMRVEGHIAECTEKEKRMVDHFRQNSLDHSHLNDHLDKMDCKMDVVTRNVALITGGAVVIGTILSYFFR